MAKRNISFLLKPLSIICTVMLILSALFIPGGISVFAEPIPVTENQAVTFGFEVEEGSVTGQGDPNNLARGNDGMGCASWGIVIRTEDGATGIGYKHTNYSAYWSDPGGYRLNNNDGVYMLDTNTTYTVSFKLRVKSGPFNTEKMPNEVTSSLKLGYGFRGATSNNTLSAMDTVISEVYSSVSVPEADKAKSTFKLTTAAGTKQLPVGDTWYDLSYVFTTPQSFASNNSAALGFFATNYYGTNFMVDDVTVVKLGENMGAAVLVDEYYGTTEAVYGEIGTEIQLPALSGTDASHEFLGWYKDSDRTVSANGITFTKETQTLYTAWNAPVTITFIDGLNNKTYEATGRAGETITYPAEPTDTVNNPVSQWFMGWYTTESYTEEFTTDKFGYSSYSVYAKWQGEIADQVQDFENYTRDERKVVTISGGAKRYHNRLYFGTAMQKIADPTGNNKGFVAGINWDSSMVQDNNDPSTYDAATRYSTVDNVIHMENINLIENNVYTITFDYYVEEMAEGLTLEILPISRNASDVWSTGISYKNTQGAYASITAADKDGQWHKATFTITAKFMSKETSAIHFVFALSENKDAVVYIDNVTFATTKPYESTVTYHANNGTADVVYKGNRGEDVPSYIPENGGLSFMGWYLDEELTVPFTNTVFGRKPITVYAKWGGQIVEFNNYSAHSNRLEFSELSMSIDKTEGAGYEDNFALDWHYDGDLWNPRQNDYVCNRDSVYDNVASLVRLENNTTYEITYYLKTESANTDYYVGFASGSGGNIWGGGAVFYKEAIRNISVSDVGKGWVKKSVVITTNFGADSAGASANVLYLVFYARKQTMESDVQATLDRVTIVPTEKDVLLFNSGVDTTDTAYQLGKAGDTINFPTMTNGEAQFLGWYADENCDIPFTDTVLKEGKTEIYAKWSATPITFENYKYVSASHYVFGKNMLVNKESGTGVDKDDYTLRFDFDGTRIYRTNENGKVETWNDRGAGAVDNIARLGELQNNAVYKITYYYRSNAVTNIDGAIVFLTCNNNNIWGSGRVSYPHTTQVVPAKTTEWTKAEAVIYTDFADPSYNMLYMGFGSSGKANGNMRIIIDVDNVLIEKLERPYIYFNGLNDEYGVAVKGEPGQAITLPANPSKFGYVFNGWYTDKETTVKFTQTHFSENDALVVYAGYSKASTALFNFENYNLTSPEGWHVFGDGGEVAKGPAYSGSHAAKFDRSEEASKKYRSGYVELGDNKTGYDLDTTKKYVVTFKYYVAKNGTKDASISFASGHKTSRWHNAAGISDSFVVNIMTKTGVWHTGALVIDATLCIEGSNYLFVMLNGGNDGLYYIDDVKITALPKGHNAYVVDNGGCSSVPMYVSGPIGSSFYSKLPTEPKYDNHEFKGYVIFDKNSNKKDFDKENAVFSEDKMKIKANFVRITTEQTFEDGYDALLGSYADYGTMDFDWELYNAKAEGNLSDNVTSGDYALRRKGNTMFFENAQVLTQNKTLTAGQRYTITMKVKLGKHLQTDGAVKFVSNRTPYYPWATTGDYYPIAVISDLTDGQWHTVNYTFVATEMYLSVQTPGYCEIFIDDILIELVDSDTPLTQTPKFTEYVPAARDADGNLIDFGASNIDVTQIIDSSVFGNKFNVWPFVIIGGGVVLLAAGAVLVVLLIKKKRKKA